ncbi:EF-P lysine aminoacylase EpmA [Rhizobium sp. L1K21]|uniref:EF-P lysine aminoacylase EpmA n=1 Tax=Rhizobium sp. L1K21 TaxID=2954933 RepID=UPI0020922CE5|nr:EF-P lysine aminoacylase EpmA [Rhizobium sp. L1K21]MCO6184967.1 EF-P lysine aminoacylase EpmA [Rhizobium sp. L1K21]
MTEPSPWWKPERHADRRPLLIGRNRVLAAMRMWFAERDFVEVDVASLQISPGNEAHLHAFSTEAISLDGSRKPLHLHTSPEFACKKLLAAGEPKIACFSHVYRNRERGPLHHPEFTMLEWYRTGENYDRLMADCADVVKLAATTTGTRQFEWRGQTCDPFAEPERLTVAEAFQTYARVDLLASIDPDGTTKRDTLATAATQAGFTVSTDDTWADIFSKIIVGAVEPHLGMGRATILMEYPVAEAALARPAPHDSRVAERFELYACGVELANAFGELTNAAEQRRRFEAEMREKKRIYGETYPIDDDLLAALEIMPQASGIALGFDRLAMLATGATHIEQVLWAPVAETEN